MYNYFSGCTGKDSKHTALGNATVKGGDWKSLD